MIKKEKFLILELIIRYLIIIFSFFIIPFLYLIFKKITFFLIYLFLSQFFNFQIQETFLIFSDFNVSIEIIEACVASSAYFLFLIINLSTRDIKIVKRIFLLLFCWICFLFLNIIRILILIILFLKDSVFFTSLHKVSWYFLSTFLVFIIWVLGTSLFKIKTIPFYSDLVFIKKLYKY